MPERIQKILARWGIASRRKAEQMIIAGRVRCNGQIVTLGDQATPGQDQLAVDGQLLQAQNRPEDLYILLNKPRGVMSTCHDPHQRRTVLGCLPSRWQRGYGLHPVGRLDADSTGAILLTNDGVLTLALTHPRYHLPKTYKVWVAGHPKQAALRVWRQGVELDGVQTRRAVVRVLRSTPEQTLLEVILREGRNRQIRRIAAQLGYPVVSLHRSAIGRLGLKSSPDSPSLALGEYRQIAKPEIEQIFQLSTLLGKLNLPQAVSENSVCGSRMIS
ncbi:MAG: rRNA pseudouridine synthase [Spirulina sp. SIO3F2]|nr:rRNA pseudouridine synthase [Spirulina sp. SIO3F2]